MADVKSYNKRLGALRSERSTFIPLWQDLSDYHLSHRGRFLSSENNKGYKRNTKQINNTSRLSVRVLASGLMSGITSPARPWFRLSTGDNDLDDIHAVKAWLHEVQRVMYKVFSQSNTYNSLHQLYAELGVFGTAAMGIYHDFENVIWCKPYTIGSYMIGVDGQNVSDSFYREYEVSVGQVVKQFGIDNVSNTVKRQWDTGNTEAWVKIVHVIEPNDDRDNISPLASDKAWRSVYYEAKCSKRGETKFLRRSGFDEFPIVTPRWDITGEDIYATDCPGMTALGDTKALQLGERRMYQAVDKVVNPPLQGPSSLKSKISSGAVNAGDVIYHDMTNNVGLKSIYDFRPDLGAVNGINDKAEDRIKRAFYEDLFMMIANSDRRQITAREVAEKHEEKLLMLGPVLERLHTELLNPLIDRTFNILQRNGVLPLPPPELQNRELSVEYVSVLAQAQRLAATGAVDRLTQFTAQVAGVWPEARHKIDINRTIDEYAESLGTDPAIVRSNEDAATMAQAEQQAMAQAQAMAALQQGVDTAKTASEIDTSGDGSLGTVMRDAGLA